MIRIITVIYLLLYVGLLGVDVFGTSTDPLWMIVLECICRVSAIACISLYILNIRPQAFMFLFRVVPVALVSFDILSWYYALFVEPQTSFSMWVIVSGTIGLSIFLFPSWYMCVRFGYLTELKTTSPQFLKRIAIVGWSTIFVLLFVVIFFGNHRAQQLSLDVARVMGSISLLAAIYRRRAKVKNQTSEVRLAARKSSSSTRKW